MSASHASAMQAFGTTKWPRHYATEIFALQTREERRAALAEVPETIRDWVRILVEDQMTRPHAKKKKSG